MPFLGLGVPVLAGAGAGGGTVLAGTAATGATISTGTLLAGAAVVGTGLILTGDTPVNSVAAGAISPALTPGQRAEQMRKAQEIAKGLAATAAAACSTGKCPCHKTVVVSQSAYPESANHILDAQAAGQPMTLTIDRGGANARRQASTGRFPREPGKQPDEYPPAMFLEGGAGASVRNITASDNMGSGASIGNQLRPPTRYPDGCKATIVIGP
ncbi:MULTISPECIES: NucA/NucB deoxyribonuclease domain-containing protein [unclassified Phyllobacterium]|uniref:NucA/NucB deoxyribonuclease domain-containing protein n=1 Tax=unclassified Phyllobacterium TaxID=2638441 RepID=UPI003012C5E1